MKTEYYAEARDDGSFPVPNREADYLDVTAHVPTLADAREWATRVLADDDRIGSVVVWDFIEIEPGCWWRNRRIETIRRPPISAVPDTAHRIAGQPIEFEIVASTIDGDQVAVFHAPDASYVMWSYDSPRKPELDRYPDRTAAITAYAKTVAWWAKNGLLSGESAPREGSLS